MIASEMRAKIRVNEAGCWLWTGAKNDMGYGQMTVEGRTQYVHRILYERCKGAIPKGHEIDHLCRTPPCCNPEHLEAVTHRVNLRRGIGNQYRNATHCIRGHAFKGKNFYRYWDKAHSWYRRICRLCEKAQYKKRLEHDGQKGESA